MMGAVCGIALPIELGTPVAACVQMQPLQALDSNLYHREICFSRHQFMVFRLASFKFDYQASGWLITDCTRLRACIAAERVWPAGNSSLVTDCIATVQESRATCP